MRRVLAITGIAATLLSGCGQSRKPKLAGGKPVEYWLEALNNNDAQVRKKAVFKLGNVATADPAALPAIINELKDRDPVVRCEAILALVKTGPAAREALPTLTDMLRDQNAQVRVYAARACKKLQDGT